MAETVPIGERLREWRLQRKMSQLDLAVEANISTRHLSFVETGRAAPSREMVLHLSEVLDVPLRDRNLLLTAAGFAPVYRESRFDDPELQAARRAVELILAGHEPCPALAFDRRWTLILANRALMRLLKNIDQGLLEPPVNVLRLALHPRGLAPHFLNLAEYRAHAMKRLSRQAAITGDPFLSDLMREFSGYPITPASQVPARRKVPTYTGLIVRIELFIEGVALSFFGANTTLGTPIDVTLSEIAIESFFPADSETAEALRRMSTPSS